MTAAEVKSPLVVISNQLELRTPAFRNALPPHIKVERFQSAAMTAIRQNPDLIACNRQSLWNAFTRAASDGLLPDGREGAVVAFKDHAQWLPMVGGLLKRFRNSGQFKSISADIVREGEEFSYWKDEHGPHIRHVPGDGTGNSLKAYAIALTADGGIMVEVMSEAQINKRRNVSRAKDSPLWRDWSDEAWKKTVLRNLCKYLPMSSDLEELIHHADEEYEFENKPATNLKPIANVSGALDVFSAAKEDPPREEPQLPMQDDETELSPTPEQEAFEQGRQARADGLSRKAVPPEYRSPDFDAMARAWQFGWDKK